jgi:hypothetical protein
MLTAPELAVILPTLNSSPIQSVAPLPQSSMKGQVFYR